MMHSTASPAQLAISALAFLCALAFLFWRTRIEKPSRDEDPKERAWIGRYNRFAEKLEPVTRDDTASLLLQRVDKTLKDVNDARAALDSKASSLLSFVGGGAGVLAVIGRSSTARVSVSALVAIGTAALLATLIYALAVVWGKPRAILTPLDQYCSEEFLGNPRNKARLAALLAFSGIAEIDAAADDAIAKGNSLTRAQFFFVLGAAVLVLNFFVQ